MLIIGLTGSIGMGKSTAAAHFRERGVPVFDADAEVHELYAGKAQPLIEAAFPGTTVGGRIDRAKLAAEIADAESLSRLESIVHPLVQSRQRAFLQAEAHRGTPVAVLEIPLLFETGGDAKVDVVVVVSAPPAVQRERVLARPGMTPEFFERLTSRQLPDDDKRRRADFVVDTNGPVAACANQIDAVIDHVRNRPASAYARFWA